MSSTLSRDKEFIDRLSKITVDNLSNEQFGVNELASKIGMSRSNLHRRVKSAAGVSISKFICQVRLHSAAELLQGTSSTISEVAFECGFHSVSYFTKCFHDHYGYPPGKVRSDGFKGSDPDDLQKDSSKYRIVRNRKYLIAAIAGGVVITSAIILIILLKPFGSGNQPLDKSIAVLPFRNDSPDEEKMYFINSIQAAIIDNLSNIEDLRVIERGSVEQYRHNPKPLVIIAKEMKVSYILAGNGFKDEDNIRLSIRLIEAKREKRLWSRSFDRKTIETYALVSEIPQLVAREINSVITPEEKKRIEKIPSTSLTAYDFYQRGTEKLFDVWMDGDTAALEESEYLFYKALEYDSMFAAVYGRLAMIYSTKWHYLASWKGDYEEMLDSSIRIADKAITMDDQCAEAYSHKGWCLVEKGQNELALETLKEALVYNPNLWEAYNTLGDAYTQLDKPDLAIANYYRASILHRGKMLPFLIRNIGDYLAHMGFKDQAQAYFQELLDLDGDSIQYLKAMSNLAINHGDFNEGIRYAERWCALDTSIWAIYQLAMYHMYLGHFEDALTYFGKKGFINYYDYSQRIGYAYWQLGDMEKAAIYFNKMIHISNENIKSDSHPIKTYSYYNNAGIYAFLGEEARAFEYLRLFNQDLPDNIFELSIDMLTLIQNDPLFDGIRDEPEFHEILSNVEARYQVRREKVRNWMEKNEIF